MREFGQRLSAEEAVKMVREADKDGAPPGLVVFKGRMGSLLWCLEGRTGNLLWCLDGRMGNPLWP